ncbi:MAG: IS4 family transposase [Thermoplasmatota archaeon]
MVQEPGIALTAAEWASMELGDADFGDSRLRDRAARILDRLGSHPDESIPDSMGTWANTKAAYRFFSNPNVEAEEIRRAHGESTLVRSQAYPYVIAAHDTTALDFTSKPSMRGTGPISELYLRGIMMHSCVAVSPDGQFLGVLGQHTWERDDATHGKKKRRHSRSMGEKESAKWEALAREVSAAAKDRVRLLHVADREADIHEFLAALQDLGDEFVIRATQNRRLEGPTKWLWDLEESLLPLGVVEAAIARSGHQEARKAKLAVRASIVTLLPPKNRVKGERPNSIRVNIVFAQESDAPSGVEPVHWRLLTSKTVGTLEEAAECVRLYALRWRIERYHYVLKSGCRIEELQLESVEGVHRAVAMYAIVASRLLATTYASRVTPEVSCVAYFSKAEWKILGKKFTGTVPTEPPTLRQAVRWTAQLGGFLARKGDGEPGVKVLWRGFQKLDAMALGYELMRDVGNE